MLQKINPKVSSLNQQQLFNYFMQIRNLGKAELGRGGMGPLTGRSGVELGQQEWRLWWD